MYEAWLLIFHFHYLGEREILGEHILDSTIRQQDSMWLVCMNTIQMCTHIKSVNKAAITSVVISVN